MVSVVQTGMVLTYTHTHTLSSRIDTIELQLLGITRASQNPHQIAFIYLFVLLLLAFCSFFSFSFAHSSIAAFFRTASTISKHIASDRTLSIRHHWTNQRGLDELAKRFASFSGESTKTRFWPNFKGWREKYRRSDVYTVASERLLFAADVQCVHRTGASITHGHIYKYCWWHRSLEAPNKLKNTIMQVDALWRRSLFRSPFSIVIFLFFRVGRWFKVVANWFRTAINAPWTITTLFVELI